MDPLSLFAALAHPCLPEADGDHLSHADLNGQVARCQYGTVEVWQYGSVMVLQCMAVWQYGTLAVYVSMAVCGTLRHRLNLNPRDWRRPPAANTEFDMSNVGVLFFKDSALITCVCPGVFLIPWICWVHLKPLFNDNS